MKTIFRVCTLIFTVSLIFGMGFANSEINKNYINDIINNRAVKLFELANEHYHKRKYGKAANTFLDCYLINPLSEIGFDAMVMESYCLYMQKRYKSAIAAIDDVFLLRSDKINSIDWVYLQYLKILTRAQSYVSPDFCNSDIEIAKEESNIFLQKYPTSEYSKVVQHQILNFIANAIFDKNLHVGRNCMVNNNYSGAIERFLLILNDERKNSFKPEAFYRLLECYFSLGIKDDMQDRFNKYVDLIDFGDDKQSNIWYVKSYNLLFTKKMVLHNKKGNSLKIK